MASNQEKSTDRMAESSNPHPKVDTTEVEKGMADLLSHPAKSSPPKTVEDVIAEMVLETPLAKAKDLMSMMHFALPSHFGRLAHEPGDGPDWYK